MKPLLVKFRRRYFLVFVHRKSVLRTLTYLTADTRHFFLNKKKKYVLINKAWLSILYVKVRGTINNNISNVWKTVNALEHKAKWYRADANHNYVI